MTSTAKHVVAERTGTKNGFEEVLNRNLPHAAVFWGSAPDPGVYRLVPEHWDAGKPKPARFVPASGSCSGRSPTEPYPRPAQD